MTPNSPIGSPRRNLPRDPVMVKVHGSQAGGKRHFGRIKFHHVPRQIHNQGGLV